MQNSYAISRSLFFRRLSISGIDNDFSSGALFLNNNLFSFLSGVILRFGVACEANFSSNGLIILEKTALP